MEPIRFCLYEYQSAPVVELRERWRRAEELGFDVVWNVDSLRDPDRERSPMLDGPAMLAAMAEATRTIRIGTLVSSMYFRHPVLLARSAIAIDHLSNGRLEIALGVGDPSVGPEAVGVEPGEPGARVERFREFVELTDLLLRQEVTTFHGEHYRCERAEAIPGPVQRPRPPLTVGAHGPRMLRIAAATADVWSQWGGYGIETEGDFHRTIVERGRRFDGLCAELGRDPSAIRHSLVCFPPLRPWASVDAFEDLVGRYAEAGIDEFVLYPPGRWESGPEPEAVFEAACAVVLPSLRAGRAVGPEER